MQDAWRAYLELAMGLTEAPRKKAQDAVKRVVGQGGATAAQLQSLAEELVSTGLANREALTKLVRFEVDRALGAVGLATADEVAELTRRVHDLERQLREAKGTGTAEPGAPTTAAPGAAAPPAADGLGPAAETAGAGEVTPSGEQAAEQPTAPAAGQPSTPAGEQPTTPTAEQPTTPAAEAPMSAPPVPARTKAVAKKAVAKKAIAKKPAATVARTPAEESPASPTRPVRKAAGRKDSGGTGS
ncbi:phasin family protein [Micromonospora chersina]|uniref:phasin family protein n=1 Tax=Micromonospora chersina TaxID=47854 RepID=UPI00372393B9